MELRQYLIYGRIINQQSKAVISLFLSYIYIVLQIKGKCCNAKKDLQERKTVIISYIMDLRQNPVSSSIQQK